jgi:hypothetical protein
MSSESSIERGQPARDSGFQIWHLFLLLSMAGAIWVVAISRHTQPAALLLISVAVVGAGFVGLALYYSFSGFFGGAQAVVDAPLAARAKAALEEEKSHVLRSIKELEFDRAMGKVSDADFAEIGGRLREHAMSVMEQLDARPVAPAQPVPRARKPPRPASDVNRCANCGSTNDADARFCKRCGQKL